MTTITEEQVAEAFGRRAGPGRALAAEAGNIARACRDMAVRFHRGGRLLVFGNGAQATDAAHIAVEFVHPVIVGKRALPALSLAADGSALTGTARDAGFEETYAAGVRLLAGAADIVQIGRMLDELEEAAGMTTDTVKLVAICTETPAAMFNLASYIPPHPRLIGLTWGAEDLAAAVGATSNRDGEGNLTFPYQLARAQCLFAAAGAGVLALDTPYTDFRDAAGLAADCARARRDGFAGRLAIHPDQIEPINVGFTPSDAELAEARAIVAAFEANPGAGTLGINGKMVDAPHLKAARRVLAAGD